MNAFPIEAAGFFSKFVSVEKDCPTDSIQMLSLILLLLFYKLVANVFLTASKRDL